MSRPSTALLFGGAVGLAIALCVLTSCSAGRGRSPTRAEVRPATESPARTAQHVYGPGPPPATATSIAERRWPAPFSDPALVARAEASAVCNFDWHQTLATRIAQARAFATPAYQHAMAPTPADAANWQRTQRDRESAACSGIRSVLVATAPNTPTVRFERVGLTQRVGLARDSPSAQPFEVLYRVERQADGRWLVGADGEGG